MAERIPPIDTAGAVYPYQRDENESAPTWHPVSGGHVTLAEARAAALDQLTTAEAEYAAAVNAQVEAERAVTQAQAELERRRQATSDARRVVLGRQHVVQRLTGVGKELIA